MTNLTPETRAAITVSTTLILPRDFRPLLDHHPFSFQSSREEINRLTYKLPSAPRE